MVNNELIYLNGFNLSIFKKNSKKYIYIYNDNYFCVLNFNNNVNIMLKNQKYIELKYNKPQVNKVYNYIGKFLKQFTLYEFTKIKFTGKGYKIKKNTSKSMVLIFNRAHMTTI